jgi:hypothetical protein
LLVSFGFNASNTAGWKAMQASEPGHQQNHITALRRTRKVTGRGLRNKKARQWAGP